MGGRLTLDNLLKEGRWVFIEVVGELASVMDTFLASYLKAVLKILKDLKAQSLSSSPGVS